MYVAKIQIMCVAILFIFGTLSFCNKCYANVFINDKQYKIYIDGEPGIERSLLKSKTYDIVYANEKRRKETTKNIFWADWYQIGLQEKIDVRNTSFIASSNRSIDLLYTSSNCNSHREAYVKNIRMKMEEHGLRFEFNGLCNAGSHKKRISSIDMPEFNSKMMISMSRSQNIENEALDEKLLKPMLFGAIPVYIGTGHRLAVLANYPNASNRIDRLNFKNNDDFTTAIVEVLKLPTVLNKMQKGILSHKWRGIRCHDARTYLKKNIPVWLPTTNHSKIFVSVKGSRGDKHHPYMPLVKCLFDDIIGVKYKYIWAAKGDIHIDQCCWG